MSFSEIRYRLEEWWKATARKGEPITQTADEIYAKLFAEATDLRKYTALVETSMLEKLGAIDANQALQATATNQDLQATSANQDLLKTVTDTISTTVSGVKTGTDKIIADMASATKQDLLKTVTDTINTTVSGVKAGTDKIIASAATAAKQDLLKTVTDTISTTVSGVKTGTDKIIADMASATNQALQATAAKQDIEKTSIDAIKTSVDAMKTVTDGIKVGTDKIIASAATAAKQDLQATAAKQDLQATAAKQDTAQTSLTTVQDLLGMAIASNDLVLSSDALVTTTDAAYIKKKELTMYLSGIYRIKFDLKVSTVSADGYAMIYRNGVGYGTARLSEITTYTTFSEDLYFFNGDLMQIYMKVTGGNTVSLINFRIYATRGLGAFGGVIT